jgi:hypothetical protein
MAKDGTSRGGSRPGSGAKKKPIADKIVEGRFDRPLVVMDFSNAIKLTGAEMPKPSKLLNALQKNGKTLGADKIFKETWTWLNERGCAELVSPQLLERYALTVARWIQCEEAVTEYGFLAKHPTTGAAIQSPYVAISLNYQTQLNRLWFDIFQTVKENCTSNYSGSNPQDDVMERLLTARKG